MKERDEKGRFKYNGGSKKRIRTEYNRKYWKEVRNVGKRKEEYLKAKKISYLKHYHKNTERCRKWASLNREKKNTHSRNYHNSHKAEELEYSRKWREMNPDKSRYAVHRRRIRLLKAVGSHTEEQWQLLIKLTGNICVACKKPDSEVKLTIDHIKPLFVGGTDNIDNIQPLCRRCNSSKGIKVINYLEEDTAQPNGRTKHIFEKYYGKEAGYISKFK